MSANAIYHQRAPSSGQPFGTHPACFAPAGIAPLGTVVGLSVPEVLNIKQLLVLSVMANFPSIIGGQG
jgi:hypothetical protein